MKVSANGASRRSGVTAAHSLHRFVFSVPDLDVAERFYTEFGLDVRRDATRIDLHTFGNSHCWGSVFEVPGPKKLQYLSFGIFEDDFAPLQQQLDRAGIARTAPHPLSNGEGIWVRDPDGNAVQLIVANKVSPDEPAVQSPPAQHARDRGRAPARSQAGRVRPRRMSHVLLFSSDVLRSVKFYGDALGLRLSDRSGEIIAFMHGAHSSDHHMLAFAKSEGPGYHHSSWDVGSIDDIGLGMQHMVACGHVRGWGIGRHVIGSNYFYYVQDPWGSFAEYSYDIDFIAADVDWPAADHPPEDSFYVWGPPPPDYFIQNKEVL
jgi:catechol 2,3-dioxygenase-like lactoylglutathione lyase family enzyme